MKKCYPLLCLLTSLILIPGILLSQSIIWEENFEDYTDGTGIEGTSGPDTSHTGDFNSSFTKWSFVTLSTTSLQDADDYFKTNSGMLEAQDAEGGIVWLSEEIDISAFSDVAFSLIAKESGDLEADDSLSVYFSTDGGSSYTLIADWNGKGSAIRTLMDDWDTEAIVKTGINGSSLRIKIIVACNAASENLRVDNIRVFTLGGMHYCENFSSQNDKGATGGSPATVDTTNVNWDVNIDESGLTASTDYFKVDNEIFTSRDVDEEQQWFSPHLDVSGKSTINISIDLSSSDGLESSDYIQTGYEIDGGDFVEIANHSGNINGTIQDQISVDVSGNEVFRLLVKADNNAGDEYYYFDNVLIRYSMPEPDNQPNSFSATAVDFDVIKLEWSDNAGANAADSFLIKTSSTSLAVINAPVDGTVETDDRDLTDGNGTIRVANGEEAIIWSGFDASTTYYFKIFPYTNFSSDIDYKTDGTVQTTSTTTDGTPAMAGDLVITEVAGDGIDGNSGDNDGYMEIYNSSASDISLNGISVRYYNNGSTTPSSTLALSGTINSEDYITITQNNTNFKAEYGVDASFEHSSFYFNGDDDGVDVYYTGAKSGVIDEFNDNGPGATPWSWNEDNVYIRSDQNVPGDIYNNWIENTDGGGTPFPVNLLYFRAQAQSNGNLLSWATAAEQNNAYFSIEYSMDGQNFELITEVRGNGNSNSSLEYEFLDVNKPVEGYYRLSQTDYDGTRKQLKTVDISAHEQSEPPLLIEMKGHEQLLLKGLKAAETIICIYNAAGSCVYTKTIKTNAGQSLLNLPPELLKSGIYFIHVNDSYRSASLKILH